MTNIEKHSTMNYVYSNEYRQLYDMGDANRGAQVRIEREREIGSLN